MSKATAKQQKVQVLKSGCSTSTMFLQAVLGIGLMAAITAGIYYHKQYFVTVPQGVVFEGQDVSGFSRPEATALVEQAASRYEEQSLQVLIRTTESLTTGMHGSAEALQTLPVKEWGLKMDISQTVDDLFRVSEQFGKADVFGAPIARQKKMVVPKFVIRDLDHVLAWIHEREREPRDASLTYDESSKQWVLSPDQDGLKYSEDARDQLEEQLNTMLLNGEQQKKLSISLQRLPATLLSADLLPLFDQIQAMMVPKISWEFDGITTVFSLMDHQDMIVVDHDSHNVGLDDARLSSFIKDYAATIDKEAGAVLANEATLQDKGYFRSTYVGNFHYGRVLDQADLFEKLLAGLRSGAAESTLELIVIEKEPTVALAGVGTLTRLSNGSSSYKLANIPDRIHNVKFGLTKYDGVVIQPGEEFSFNQKLGIVTYAAGWKPALAIFGGGGVSKVPGGGLCQVSTTMYRAAILAGLPVTKRKAHSLDVSYYHEGGYGIDATIYPPTNLDLKFVNDTPGPIFIHAYSDDDQLNAYIDFYGLSDGRSVELTPNENYTYINKNTGKRQRYIAWDWMVNRADGSAEKRKIETVYYGGH